MKFILSLLAASAFAQFTPAPMPAPYKPTDAELQAIKTHLSKPPSLSFSNPDVSADVAVYFKAGEWILRHPEEFLTKAYYDNFNAELQFPYLRIPGAFEYWTALDIHLSEAATGQVTPAEALAATVSDFESITDRLGRDAQLEQYKSSLGFE